MSLSASKNLGEIWVDGLFTDATIITSENKQFEAHRVILAAHSGYFRAACTSQIQVDSTFTLPIISANSLSMILDHIYNNQICDLNDENVCELYVAADYLAVESVVQVCTDFIIARIDAEIAPPLLGFARKFNIHSLEDAVWKYMCREMVPVSEKMPFLDLSKEDLIDILKSDYLNVKREEQVWQIAEKWMDGMEGRRQHAPEILHECVRIQRLEPQFFLSEIRQNPFIAEDPKFQPDSLGMELWNGEFPQWSPDDLDKYCTRYPREILFAIGGWSHGSPTAAIETYDVRANEWTMMNESETDPIGRRAYHGSVVVGNKIYTIGGYNGVEYYNSCRCFDIADRTWREIAPMNRSRCYVSVAVCGQHIYAFGGYNGSRRQNTAEKYDLQSNQWTMLPNMHHARSDACAASLDGMLYVVGGFDGVQCLSSAEKYSPITNRWTPLPDMSSPRSGVSCAQYNGKLYVFGGFNGQSRMRSGEMFDPDNHRWVEKAPMLSVRSNFGLEVVDERLLAIGGFDGQRVTGLVESYSDVDNRWVSLCPMKIAKSALSTCVARDIPNVEHYAYHLPEPSSPPPPRRRFLGRIRG